MEIHATVTVVSALRVTVGGFRVRARVGARVGARVRARVGARVRVEGTCHGNRR